MKFKDLITGNVIETENEFVIEQNKKHTEKYKEIKEKPAKKADKE